jgi:hypothetical protein
MSATGSPLADHPAVVYALTRQGYELPVIDVSHPSFAVPDDPGSVEALRMRFSRAERLRKGIPKVMMSWLLRGMAHRSLLARELFVGQAGVLPGLSTYVIKLGANNLVAPFDSPLDKRLAASPGAMSLRLRLQQLAWLLADGLRPELQARPQAPLHLIDIGGGTAIDSLNTLILLRKSAPTALRRPITIHILDPDTEGPEFGRQALATLVRDGPLGGLDVGFTVVPYDWNDASALADLVRELDAEAIVAASSEGALFEYADDHAILANLRALRAGNGVVLAGGTVTRADNLTRDSISASRFRLIPRGAHGLEALARQAGFTLSQTRSAILSDQVLLRPAQVF